MAEVNEQEQNTPVQDRPANGAEAEQNAAPTGAIGAETPERAAQRTGADEPVMTDPVTGDALEGEQRDAVAEGEVGQTPTEAAEDTDKAEDSKSQSGGKKTNK